MSTPYLEINFRHGRPFAAYLHCAAPVKAAASVPLGLDLILDQDAAGLVIGIEITDPIRADAIAIRALLADHGVIVSAADLAPLAA
jgi:hypothetical protein